MPQVNGYIQIEFVEKEAICHFYPPKEGGDFADVALAEDFMQRHDFKSYDVLEFRNKLSSGKEETMSLGMTNGINFSESMTAEISEDKMSVSCTFFPPSVGGNTMNAQDIMMSLDNKGVRYGIDQTAILDFIKDRVYCTPVVLAKGTEVQHGSDASIEYFFNTDLSLKPAQNEDGSVDYHNLNTIASVEKGDLLARLTPADKGKNGQNVLGEVIQARQVKTLKLEFGKNISTNEERTELYSDVTGHVTLTGGKVFVSDVYDVAADVDNSTGNIKYDGNVHVAGNVRGGFEIIARGDVIVEGVVEDALVRAGGQIVVKRGIHGMSKGTLVAGTNVLCKFIENAKVSANGYVQADSILHSQVSAGEDVIVNARKGFITGGTIRAGRSVQSQTIGSQMGADMQIEVGMSPEHKERYNALQKEIMEAKQTVDKLQPVIAKYQAVLKAGQKLEPKHQIYLKDILGQFNGAKEKLSKNEEEFRRLHREMSAGTNAKVVVQKDIHPGVTIVISDVSYTVKKDLTYCEFRKIDGDVTFRSL